ncbi:MULTISPECIES: CBM96 family carbohydrate-binding protein [unclassified Nocardioides]|nr:MULTISPECIES: DNRLRE domain-containing protein [unclassified Nocardioides]
MRSDSGNCPGLVRLLLAALVGLALSLAGQGVLAPVMADVHVDDTPAPSWRLNGRTYATKIVGDTVFVGGTFTAAVSPTGQSVPRRNLAAFDLTTGALLTDWRADVDSTVQALDSDGSWLYVGGSFTNVDGQTRRRLAKVGVGSGDLDPGFAPNVNSTVRALVLDGSSLYAGGHFTSVDGASRLRVARLSTTGQLDGQFTPEANGNVFGITKAPSSPVVYVSGPFGQLNGVNRNGVGGLNAVTGATTGPSFGSSARPTLGLTVNEDGTMLYGAGGSGLNAVSAWNSSTGVRVWTHRAMGDIQAIEHYDGTVYFGFHEGFQGNTGLRILAADDLTGALDPDFRPTFNLFWGVDAIDVTADGVVVGGDFTQVSGVAAQGWARFPGSGTPDETAPSPPTGLHTTSVQPTSVALSWSAASDDRGVAGYDVTRDGVPVAAVGGTTLTFNDTALQPESTYRYAVRARDAAGNESAYSAELLVTTPELGPEPEELVFGPSDDATVRQDQPQGNFGGTQRLSVDLSPAVQHSLIRFEVDGVAGRDVERAVLSLAAVDQSEAGGTVAPTGEASWDEDTVTWNTAPAAAAPVATLPRVNAGVRYDVDVTSLVTADGDVSLRLQPQSANGADYGSKEAGAALAPRLEVTVAGEPDPPDPPTDDPVLVGAGDIAACETTDDEATAALLDDVEGTVMALGDTVYPDATAQQFADCYGPSWGRHLDRTRPAVGNHEYQSPDAAPYFAYFGSAAGQPDQGWYSYDVGTWHIVVLNSNCARVGGCGTGSPQEQWLRADLEQTTRDNIAAYWHHPWQVSGTRQDGTEMGDLWGVLHQHGAEFVVAGHEHFYERFAPLDALAQPDPSFGMRSFVVGTGGRSLYPLPTPATHSVVQGQAFGVLKVTLHEDSYEWEFLPVPGSGFTDSGISAVHPAPPEDTEPPTAPTGLIATQAGQDRIDLAWAAASDNQAVLGYQIERDATAVATVGDLLAYSDTGLVAGRAYTYRVRARDGGGNWSAWSEPATATTSVPSDTIVIPLEQDSTARADLPTRNFGAAATWLVDGNTVKDGLLRVDVAGVGDRQVLSATLHVHCVDPSNNGGSFFAMGTGWDEGSVTWNTAPPATGPALDTLGRVTVGQDYDVDLTGYVTGDGSYALRVASSAPDGADYASSESTTAPGPVLELTLGPP